MYNKKMFATSRAFTSNLKGIAFNMVFKGFSQGKKLSMNGIGSSDVKSTTEIPKFSINTMAQNISFGITQAKHISQVSHQVVLETHLKRIEKTGTTLHCFNPKTHQQEDVPIRILRTHYTVTFMPSVQFLEKEFAENKKQKTTYNGQKDSTLSVYKFSCQNCGHEESRSFPENGYKFGTVITGCDQCHEVMVVSDKLGWLEAKKQKHPTDVIFSRKQVEDLIKKNLKKVGINVNKQHDLD